MVRMEEKVSEGGRVGRGGWTDRDEGELNKGGDGRGRQNKARARGKGKG